MPVEHVQPVIHELAQTLLPEPDLAQLPPLLLQKGLRYPRALRRRRRRSLPLLAAVLPVLIKNPRLPQGVLNIHKSPPDAASIGRRALYTTSGTRAASSITRSETAENPRIAPSVPGSPTILDPFGNSKLIAFFPSPRGRISSRATISLAFLNNSALCRPVGLTATTKLPSRVYARCTALIAATVDFPHCAYNSKSRAWPRSPAPAPVSRPAQTPAASANS